MARGSGLARRNNGSKASYRCETPVHQQGVAGDKASGVARKVNHRGGDFLRLRRPAERYFLKVLRAISRVLRSPAPFQVLGYDHLNDHIRSIS